MAVVLLKTQYFCNMKPRVLSNSYRSFRANWCLHFQVLNNAIKPTDTVSYPRRRVFRISSIIRDLDWVPCQAS